jgi:pimeloyl-ACP methyl ester carboxylesterase
MIYALPGMGADKNMYPGAWQTLADCKFVEWPTYNGEDSIAAIAKRITTEQKIRAGDVLIGSSLGGIVACEMAEITQVGSLVLVGGAKKKEEISGFLSMIHPLVDLTPLSFIQRLAGKIPSDVAQMFSKGQAEFIRAMCRAIFDWDGLGDVRVRLLRIHGKKDRVIPLPEGVQHILDGGHFIAMTHSQECVNIIRANHAA